MDDPMVLAVVPLALQQLGLVLAIVLSLLWLAALLARALVLRRYANTSARVAESRAYRAEHRGSPVHRGGIPTRLQ